MVKALWKLNAGLLLIYGNGIMRLFRFTIILTGVIHRVVNQPFEKAVDKCKGITYCSPSEIPEA